MGQTIEARMDDGIPMVQVLTGDTVPSRFVRPAQERATFTPGEDLPIIYLDELETEAGLENLDKVCREWGSFQLMGHGVEIQSAMNTVRRFFALSQKEKEPVASHSSNKYAEGYGRYFLPSKEVSLDWRDTIYHEVPPRTIPWPINPPEYREVIENYGKKVEALGDKLVTAMLKALKHPDLDTPHHHSYLAMAINYYPTCPEADLVLGFPPHSDAVTTLTILSQEDVEGLQVLKDGRWVTVKAIPDAFVVNLGDIMEIVTNGAYKSILHRAFVNAHKPRFSLASIRTPLPHNTIKPLVLEGEAPKFKEVNMKVYLDNTMSRKMNGKTELESLKIVHE